MHHLFVYFIAKQKFELFEINTIENTVKFFLRDLAERINRIYCNSQNEALMNVTMSNDELARKNFSITFILVM